MVHFKESIEVKQQQYLDSHVLSNISYQFIHPSIPFSLKIAEKQGRKAICEVLECHQKTLH